MTSNAGKINFDMIKSFARDHVNGPAMTSICMHAARLSTSCAVIVQPLDSRLWVVNGQPCENEYVGFNVP